MNKSRLYGLVCAAAISATAAGLISCTKDSQKTYKYFGSGKNEDYVFHLIEGKNPAPDPSIFGFDEGEVEYLAREIGKDESKDADFKKYEITAYKEGRIVKVEGNEREDIEDLLKNKLRFKIEYAKEILPKNMAKRQ